MPAKSLAEKNVLIIDANQSACDRRASVLRASGVHVHTAGNVLQAETVWVSDFFDLVMLDLSHDAANGIAFWRRLKRENPKQRVLVVGRPDLASAQAA
jgi:DNA-binding NtrC family response regulator